MFLIAVETEFVTTENVNVLQDSEYKKIVVAKIQVYKPFSKKYFKNNKYCNFSYVSCILLDTTITFFDDQNEPLKNTIVMYVITDAVTNDVMPEVALTDPLMGQIIIRVNS